ncbi:TonB-dependent receptor [Calditrichota bacterium LG25]
MLIADLQLTILKTRGVKLPLVLKSNLIIKSFLLLVFVPIMVFSQNLEFYGTVLDSSSNEPLIGVNIFCEHLKIGATSNEQGYFFIPIKDVEKENIIFTFQYIGYKTKKIILDKKKKFYIVKMLPVPLESEAIQVYSSRYSSNLSFKLISPLEIKRSFTLMEPDVFRYLTTLAGVNFADDISNRIYVRGFRSDKLLILFDDFVLYNPYHLLNVTSSIDVGSLKAIEFYKALYPVTHSGRVGGMLKLYSRTGNRNRFAASLDASFISTIVRIEGPIPKGSYFFSIRKTYIDLLTRLFSDEFPYSFYDGIANVQFDLSKKHSLKISAIFNKDYYNRDKKNPSEWTNRAIGFNWKVYFSKYFYVHQNAYFSHYYSRYSPDSSLYTKNEVNDFSYRMNAFLNFNKKSTLLNLGFNLDYYNLVFDTNDLSLQIFNDKQKALLSYMYVSALLKPFSNTEVEVGTGLSYFNQNKKIILNPLFRFKYLFANQLNLEMGFAQKSQYLFTINNEKDMFPPFNIWRITPNEIGPEISKQLSIGIQKQKSHINFKAELYYNYLSPIVDFNRHYLRPNDEKFLNNKGESYGLETSLNYRYRLLSLNINYTLSRTIYTLEKNKTYYPSFHRLNKFDINLFVKLGKNWDIALHWIYASGRPFTGKLGFYPVRDYRFQQENYEIAHPIFLYANPQFKVYYSEINQMLYPAYHRLDLHIERSLSKKIKIYLDIINVYNRRNILYYEHDIFQRKKKVTRMLPILPSLGLSVKF